jgi:hypothetical protein
VTARIVAGLAVWLVAALIAGASGSLAGARPPFPQADLTGLTLALLALLRWSPSVQAWALTVDIRALVLLHVSRLVGLYFQGAPKTWGSGAFWKPAGGANSASGTSRRSMRTISTMVCGAGPPWLTMRSGQPWL